MCCIGCTNGHMGSGEHKDGACPRCGEDHGPLFIFKSSERSMKACWQCIGFQTANARAAGVEFTVSPA